MSDSRQARAAKRAAAHKRNYISVRKNPVRPPPKIRTFVNGNVTWLMAIENRKAMKADE